MSLPHGVVTLGIAALQRAEKSEEGEVEAHPYTRSQSAR
jgi:hypothetical protein